LSGLMLLIFSFSIMPKVILHDLLVHHKDTRPNSGDYAQVSKTGFHCDCDSQVVEVPYIDQVSSFNLLAPATYHSFQIRTSHQFHSFPHFIYGLRGPPASA
jgi:hypothetical protein